MTGMPSMSFERGDLCRDGVQVDADNRLDIIAAGRATNNLVVYWNDSSR